MKTILLTLLFSTAAFAETAKINVQGMVCAFCAQGIEKKFGDEPAVAKTLVNLDDHLVTLQFKAKHQLSDQRITEILSDAGFTVKSIARSEE